MHPDDEDIDFPEVRPMTAEEQAEVLLGYFSALVSGMSESEVSGLRSRIMARFPAGPKRDRLTDELDRQGMWRN